MNLCIDIGNTRVKLAIFDSNRRCKKVFVQASFEVQFIDDLFDQWKITKVILSATGTLPNEWLFFLQQKDIKIIELNADVALPIINRYASPSTLGNDRLSVVVAAQDLFPKQHVLVVDAGTCITYDFVDAAGEYWGGAILPGIQMRFRSMAHFTAKLPEVKALKPASFIGDTTTHSLQSGVMYGVLHELNGFKAQYEQQFGQLKLIITGGDASYFESQLKNEIFAEPNLVLMGLNTILEYNSK